MLTLLLPLRLRSYVIPLKFTYSIIFHILIQFPQCVSKQQCKLMLTPIIIAHQYSTI